MAADEAKNDKQKHVQERGSTKTQPRPGWFVDVDTIHWLIVRFLHVCKFYFISLTVLEKRKELGFYWNIVSQKLQWR